MDALKKERPYGFEAFDCLNEQSDKLLEYINGQIFALVSPSTNHQRISLRLAMIFKNFFINNDLSN